MCSLAIICLLVPVLRIPRQWAIGIYVISMRNGKDSSEKVLYYWYTTFPFSLVRFRVKTINKIVSHWKSRIRFCRRLIRVSDLINRYSKSSTRCSRDAKFSSSSPFNGISALTLLSSALISPFMSTFMVCIRDIIWSFILYCCISLFCIRCFLWLARIVYRGTYVHYISCPITQLLQGYNMAIIYGEIRSNFFRNITLFVHFVY